MSFTLVVDDVQLPALIVHGGAGSYLRTTSVEKRRARGERLQAIARLGQACFDDGALAATLAAMAELEDDPQFNAGYGSRLQRDGVARLSAALMDGARSRMSAVYNVQGCARPSELTAALQHEADRNLDGEGAALLMQRLGVEPRDVRSEGALRRWRKLVADGDQVDREAAIGSADERAVEAAKAADVPIPDDLKDRHGTVGVVACDVAGSPWACTSTGGRGHEAVGRISDSPGVSGTYACPLVGLSATGFGEQIIDLNVCGRIATRVLDGASLEDALRRTFDEVAAFGGLLGVIALTSTGEVGYAHTTDACGVAWIDATGRGHIDRHGRG